MLILKVVIIIVVVPVILGIVIAYSNAMSNRSDALSMGFSKEEVDDELGTGKGVIHYIKYG